MSPRTASATLALAPARIGLAVLAGFAILLAIIFAVRPDMMMDLVRAAMNAM